MARKRTAAADPAESPVANPETKAPEIIQVDTEITNTANEVAVGDAENELTLNDTSGNSLDSILPDVYAGKKLKLKGEEDVHFIFEAGRLKMYHDNGSFLDSAPLYAYQDKKGWEVVE